MQGKLLEESRHQLRLYAEKTQMAQRSFEEMNISKRQEQRNAEALKFELEAGEKVLAVCKKSEAQLQETILGLLEESSRNKEEIILLKDETSQLRQDIFRKEESSLTYETKIQFLEDKVEQTTLSYHQAMDATEAMEAQVFELKAEIQFLNEKGKLQ